MDLRWLQRGAATAERNRRRIQKTGMVGRHRVWSEAEILKLRQLYGTMTYKQMVRRFPRRTLWAIRGKAKGLGLAKKRHIWTAAEVSQLRRLYSRGTTAELRAAFPDFSRMHLARIACYHGFRRPRGQYAPSGIEAVDQIRQRASELGYTMSDIDKMARSRGYFAKALWHSGYINYSAIGKAVAALDGTVNATWN